MPSQKDTYTHKRTNFVPMDQLTVAIIFFVLVVFGFGMF